MPVNLCLVLSSIDWVTADQNRYGARRFGKGIVRAHKRGNIVTATLHSFIAEFFADQFLGVSQWLCVASAGAGAPVRREVSLLARQILGAGLPRSGIWRRISAVSECPMSATPNPLGPIGYYHVIDRDP